MATSKHQDDEDLEALFDRVVAEAEVTREREQAQAAAEAAAAAPAPGDESMFRRVGHLTRTLHESLRELGYDTKLERSVSSLPDARDRLVYIATLTGQAAEKVLSAVERGQVLQQALGADAAALAARWEQVYARELDVAGFRALAGETREFLAGIDGRTATMQAHLHEIMMAQDFHDLTGQVIRRVVEVAQSLETSLVALLVEARPAADKYHQPLLEGPLAHSAGRTDVVTSQAQVDELLDSLGF